MNKLSTSSRETIKNWYSMDNIDSRYIQNEQDKQKQKRKRNRPHNETINII